MQTFASSQKDRLEWLHARYLAISTTAAQFLAIEPRQLEILSTISDPTADHHWMIVPLVDESGKCVSVQSVGLSYFYDMPEISLSPDIVAAVPLEILLPVLNAIVCQSLMMRESPMKNMSLHQANLSSFTLLAPAEGLPDLIFDANLLESTAMERTSTHCSCPRWLYYEFLPSKIGMTPQCEQMVIDDENLLPYHSHSSSSCSSTPLPCLVLGGNASLLQGLQSFASAIGA
jgi:hypothetical protein